MTGNFEERIGKPYEGQPHWVKEFNVSSDYLKNAYPKWDDFQQLLAELDPNDQFRNSMLEGLFA